jgi:hypothetical protein
MMGALTFLSCAARGQAAADTPPPAGQSLYLKVQLPQALKVGALKPGDAVEGTLVRNVYSGERPLFPVGSHVRLTVVRMERRRRLPNDHWPWIVKVFTPRHQNFPVFQDAIVTVPSGEQRSIQVSVISTGRTFETRAKIKGQSKKDSSVSDTAPVASGTRAPDGQPQKSKEPVMTLEGFATTEAAPAEPEAPSAVGYQSAIPGGTQCRLLLLSTVSASKNRAGDKVQARLLDPVVLNSRVVLPAGSLFDGAVVKQTPPRMLSRAGSIYLKFNSVLLPDGSTYDISASVASLELDRRSHTRIDAEGRIMGERPGKVWMLINGGLTAGVSKEVDDGAQLLIEAIVSTATDASTAGVSRIVSTCASGIFILTRRGRDVVLPRFTEMEIVLSRPLSLGPSPTAADLLAPAVSQ